MNLFLFVLTNSSPNIFKTGTSLLSGTKYIIPISLLRLADSNFIVDFNVTTFLKLLKIFLASFSSFVAFSTNCFIGLDKIIPVFIVFCIPIIL